MTLVDSGVGVKEVEIAFAVDIPDEGTLSLSQDDGQRMIVMSTVPIFQIDVLLSVGGNGHDMDLLKNSVTTHKFANSFARKRIFREFLSPCQKKIPFDTALYTK